MLSYFENTFFHQDLMKKWILKQAPAPVESKVYQNDNWAKISDHT